MLGPECWIEMQTPDTTSLECLGRPPAGSASGSAEPPRFLLPGGMELAARRSSQFGGMRQGGPGARLVGSGGGG